jgi:hypothetical protein
MSLEANKAIARRYLEEFWTDGREEIVNPVIRGS